MISSDILRLCYQYYSSRKWIFAKGHAIFHMLDVTTPQLFQNVIDFRSIDPEEQPLGRTYCLIPHIPTKKVLKLFPDSDIDPKHSYLAILTEDHKIARTVADKMTLYVFRSIDGVPRPSTMWTLNQKHSKDNESGSGLHFHHLIYCGSHGVIGVTCYDVYQLKLDDIDEHLHFHAIRTSDPESLSYPGRRTSCSLQHYKLVYIEERDVLLAYDLVKTRNQDTFHCVQYNFGTNEWKTVFDRIPQSLEWAPAQDFLIWNMCYDRNSDSLYFVSNKYHVIRYDMDRAAFTLIMDSNVRKANPLSAMWMSQTRSDVICGLERGTLIFKRLDLGKGDVRERRSMWQRSSRKSVERDAAAAWQSYYYKFAREIQVMRGLRIYQ